MYESATNRLTYWFWFSLLLSLAPLAYSVWELLTQQAHGDVRQAAEAALKHGELILICVPLLGGAIGEIIKNRQPPMIGKVTIGGISILLFFFAAHQCFH